MNLGLDFPGVQTPSFVRVATFVGLICAAMVEVLAIVGGSISGMIMVSIVPAAALLRAKGERGAGVSLAVEVVAVLIAVGTVVGQHSVVAVFVVVFVFGPVIGGELYRWFRQLNEGRLRWLHLKEVAAQHRGSIRWVRYASPSGQQTQVQLEDPDTHEVVGPASLWGPVAAQQFICVGARRQVLEGRAFKRDPDAAARLKKYELS